MTTRTEMVRCEQDTRAMLRENRMPQPDWVEYGETCIRLFWEEPKVVLVVDIDEPTEGTTR